MTAFRYFTAAALASGMLVGPAGAGGQQAPAEAPAQQSSPGQPARRPVAAAQSGAAEKAPGSRRSWDAMGMRGFSVALVVGDLAGAATPDNLPAGAKKALSDMRDFLPYKSYRLLDTHWILCCSGAATASVSGRLRGAEEEEYSFYIDARPDSDGSELAVRFNLREAGTSLTETGTNAAAAERSTQATAQAREREEAARRSAQGSGQAEEAAARARFEELRRQVEAEQTARRTTTSSRGRQVLDSTFSMKVGETVVIGTSRLKGDKALIALLTAASRNATPSAR